MFSNVLLSSTVAKTATESGSTNDFIEMIKTILMGDINIGPLTIPLWSMLAVVVGIFIIGAIIVGVLGKKRVSHSELNNADDIVKDVQIKYGMSKKKFKNPVPAYVENKEIPNPETAATPIAQLEEQLFGEKQQTEAVTTGIEINETTITENCEEEPESKDEAKSEEEAPASTDGETSEESATEEKSQDEIIVPVSDRYEKEVNFEDLDMDELLDDLFEEKVEEPAPEQAVEEKVEEPAPEQAVEEKAEEPAPEQVVEEKAEEPAPEQAVEEKAEDTAPEQVVEEKVEEPAPEQAVEEKVEESAPEQVVEEKAEEPAPEQVVEEKAEDPAPEQTTNVREVAADAQPTPVNKIQVDFAPSVPVIKPSTTKKEPVAKKVNLVKAPAARPTTKTKKASQAKAISVQAKATPANSISNFAPITMVNNDKAVTIIKLFGDKIDPKFGKFVVEQIEGELVKPFRFVIKDKQGVTLFVSESYKIRPRARQIETLRKAIEQGSIIYGKDANGYFTYKLMTPDNKVFGSGMPNRTLEAAQKDGEYLRTAAAKINYIEDATV